MKCVRGRSRRADERGYFLKSTLNYPLYRIEGLFEGGRRVKLSSPAEIEMGEHLCQAVTTHPHPVGIEWVVTAWQR